MSIKIIGVAGSPRKGKATSFALNACLEAIKKNYNDVATECIDLADYQINECLACDKCKSEFACSQDDDFPNLLPTFSDPELAGLIVATPVYFGTMSSKVKAFLDRCVIFRRNGALFRNKVGGVIAVGGMRHGGQVTAIQSVHAAMLIQDMVIVGDGYSTYHFGGTLWSGHPNGYEQDEFGLETARNLGCRVVDVAKKMTS